MRTCDPWTWSMMVVQSKSNTLGLWDLLFLVWLLLMACRIPIREHDIYLHKVFHSMVVVGLAEMGWVEMIRLCRPNLKSLCRNLILFCLARLEVVVVVDGDLREEMRTKQCQKSF